MPNVHDKHSPFATKFLDDFHATVISEIQEAVKNYDVVVIGMFLNPHVYMVQKALKEANISYHYLQYGGYFSKWKPRLAIKMWSGWPTFPQVFVKGTLIGGNTRTRKAIKEGYIQSLLEESHSTSL